MRTSDAPNSVATAVPLARDAAGSAIGLPEGTAAWRVRRNTRGRPGNIVGSNGKLVTVPLGFSKDELFDLLGYGSYRLDPINDDNEVLKLSGPPITVGEPEPTSANESTAELALATLTEATSDARFVLEANVRAMQLSFQHNQRTLELGLQMADTLRAGVQVLAETQADCMKALVGSRHVFRNAGVPQLPAPMAERPAETRPDDEDEDDDDDAPNDWLQQLQPVVAVVVQQIITAIMERPKSSAPSTKRDVKELLGDALDWRRPAKRNEPAEPSRTVADVAKLLSPSLMMKLASVQGILTPAEASRGMAMFTALEPEMYPALIERLEPMSVEEIAAFLREQLARGAQAS